MCICFLMAFVCELSSNRQVSFLVLVHDNLCTLFYNFFMCGVDLKSNRPQEKALKILKFELKIRIKKQQQQKICWFQPFSQKSHFHLTAHFVHAWETTQVNKKCLQSHKNMHHSFFTQTSWNRKKQRENPIPHNPPQQTKNVRSHN